MTATPSSKLSANRKSIEQALDVEKVLSSEFDSIMNSVASIVDEYDDRWSGISYTCSTFLDLPSLSVDTDWRVLCAKYLSGLLKCEVWFIELDNAGKAIRHTTSETQIDPTSFAPMVTVAQDAGVASRAIGSSSLHASLSSSPIMRGVLEERYLTSGWCVSVPLPTLGGKLAIICLWKIDPAAEIWDSLLRLESVAKRDLIKLYEASVFLELGAKRWKRHLAMRFWRRYRLPAISGAIFCAILSMAIPFPYRPKRECTLETATRHYVASPLEGKLSRVLVRPGDEVKAGQVMAHMEDLQLRRDLVTTEAELESAIKKRDIALANSAWGDLRLARLDCQQVELKLMNLKERLSELELRSPTDGIIVQGDWHGQEGVPMTFGQTVFEVSPLNKMVCEVHLKPEDLRWVKVGSKAVLRTESTGSKSWSGTIQRVEPRAEIIDDQAVIIAEMEVDNPEWIFRPGMKGDAVVDTGYHSIGWILFHKPWRWLWNQWIW